VRIQHALQTLVAARVAITMMVLAWMTTRCLMQRLAKQWIIILGKDLVLDVLMLGIFAIVTIVARVVKMEYVMLKNHMKSVQPLVVFGLITKRTVAHLVCVIFVRVVLETVVHF
jgi:hypothetical protein